MTETVSIWQIIVVILIPTNVGMFWLLWGRDAEQWRVIDALRRDLTDHEKACLTKFATTEGLTDLKKDLDGRLTRIEDKLDQALFKAS